MKSQITPYFISLVKDAALKSFWRKRALRQFLKECKIKDIVLASWAEDETKREFVDRLFDALSRTDLGRQTIFKMAKYLSEQQSFPDLNGWEDSDVKISTAYSAVEKLRMHLNQQNEEITEIEDRRKAKETFLENQQKIRNALGNLNSLNDKLTEIAKLIGSQDGGYAFQDWFYDMMDFYEITNRRPYVHNGRQIDGSITLSGTTYLVELKFTADQSDATDIDSLYKKVSTKADNTMGVMISISGYSKIAIKEASGAKTPLLLLDSSHIYMALGGLMSFPEIMERIRRHASQTGEAYLCAKDFNG